MPKFNTADLIAFIREYAIAHYNEGWDVVVEAYDDAQIAEVLGKTTTKKAALEAFAGIVGAFDEQRTAHRNEALAMGADIPQPAGYSASEKQVEAKVARATKAKSRALFMRKPGRDAKTYKAGTKRAEIALALLKGATIDDMRAICVKADHTPWTANATRAALTTFQVNNGYGVEERDEDGVRRFFLIMPKGMESPVA